VLGLSQSQLAELPFPLVNLFQQLETDTMEDICRRIQKVGEVSPTASHQLVQLQRYGADMDAFTKRMAQTLNKSDAQVYSLLYNAASADQEAYKGAFDAAGMKWLPLGDDARLRTLYESIARATAGEIRNYASTVGFMYAGPNGTISHMPLDEFYSSAIDYAALQVRTGVTDYNTAIRGPAVPAPD